MQQLLLDNDFTEGHHSLLLFNLGTLHMLVGHVHLAALAFEDASLLCGAHIIAHYCYGIALYDMGHHLAARRAFKLCSLLLPADATNAGINYFRDGLDFILHKTMVHFNEAKCAAILAGMDTSQAGINRFPPNLLFKPTTRSKPALHLDLSKASLDELSLKRIQTSAAPSVRGVKLSQEGSSPVGGVPMAQSPMLEGALDVKKLRQERLRAASEASQQQRPQHEAVVRPRAPRGYLLRRGMKSIKDLKARLTSESPSLPAVPRTTAGGGSKKMEEENGESVEDEAPPWMQHSTLPGHLRGRREEGFSGPRESRQ